jgi:hypothetical protein
MYAPVQLREPFAAARPQVTRQILEPVNDRATSGVASFVWPPDGEHQGKLIVRVPRNPQLDEPVQREKMLLNYLHNQLGQDPVYSRQFAHVYGSRPLGRSQALLLTPVSGHPLAQDLNRWNQGYYLHQAARWLSQWQRRTVTEWVGLDHERLDWLITSYPDALWGKTRVPDLLPLSEALNESKKGVWELLRPLLGQKLPLTVVHGAFQADNIWVARGRITGLCHWDDGRTQGLPWEDFWQLPLALFQDESYSVAQSWSRLTAHRQTIYEYWQTYHQSSDVTRQLRTPWLWLPWVCLIEAMKQILPWRMDWERYQYWLEMTRCALNQPCLHE